MSDTVQFIFSMEYTDWSTDPYYHRDWYGANPIEVVAENKEAAVEKAKLALGNPPQGRRWALRLKGVKDFIIPPPNNTDSKGHQQ